MVKKSSHYVNSRELEEWWTGWLITMDMYAWDQMSAMIFKMCEGIATKFNPRTKEEHEEHSHDAFFLTMEKIRNGKLKFEPGRAPVFNLLTTTIYRHLFSKMNKENRRKKHHAKYMDRVLEDHPELQQAMRKNEVRQEFVDYAPQ
ncbi:hypothetical protein LCGC14_2278140 [marine sediment metagenome]|uniref:Uncharacterized protein n=1 Tax=marine sediment metagenome TaxID=412755 RepID=A0A0F9FQ26_9ZZZZ